MAAVTGEPDLGSSRTEERKSSSCRLNWQLFPPLHPAVDDIISQTLHTRAHTHTQMLLSVVSEASMQPLKETLREEVSDFHSKLVRGVMERLEFGCYDSSVSGL